MELQHDREQNYIFAGPLNLNKMMRQASTVMSGTIALAGNDFEALYMLAANEGKYLTLQQINEASWNTETAAETLEKLVEQINSINEEFMWIEHTPGKGYKFDTRWGQNWKRNTAATNVVNITDTAATAVKRQKPSIKTLITGAGALVAIIMLALLYILHTAGVIAPREPGPVYIETDIEIEEPAIPLGQLDLEG